MDCPSRSACFTSDTEVSPEPSPDPVALAGPGHATVTTATRKSATAAPAAPIVLPRRRARWERCVTGGTVGIKALRGGRSYGDQRVALAGYGVSAQRSNGKERAPSRPAGPVSLW